MLSSSTSEPARVAPASPCTKPRWLRASTATVRGSPPVSDSSPTAKASQPASSSAHVSAPRSSTNAVRRGARAAARAMPVVAVTPRRTTAIMRT